MRLGKVLRKYGVFFCALFFVLFFLAECSVDPASGTLHEVYKYPQELWGEWIRMDTGDTWYITSNYLEGKSLSNIKLSRKSDNVIEITEEKNGGSAGGEGKYYLYASRIPNGSFDGTIVGDNTGGIYSINGSRSMAGIGSINVTATNLNNKANEITTQTDQDGHFTADGIIPGDEYEVTAGGQSTTVTPNTNGENIGIVTLTGGVNFKTSIAPQLSGTDMMLLYAGAVEHKFNISIENTGTADCLAATYELQFPDGLDILSVPPSQILGTIEPGKKKTIPITVSCPFVSREFEYKTIGVAVADNINKKTWDDSVSIKFNRMQVDFYVKSDNAVSGIIIVPTGKAYHFKTSYSYNSGYYSASVAVPQYPMDFLVAFSGANADTEAVYSLGINTDADSDFSSFSDLGNNEPLNNEEETAPLLGMGNKIISYLHKNDIDYYKVNLGTP
jgi:hypothetical protein